MEVVFTHLARWFLLQDGRAPVALRRLNRTSWPGDAQWVPRSLAAQDREDLHIIVRACAGHLLRTLLAVEQGAWRLSDVQVVDQIVEEVCTGRLILLEARQAGVSSGGSANAKHAVDASQATRDRSVFSTPPMFPGSGTTTGLPTVEPMDHWLEIKLLGEDDKGIARAAYQVTLKSGKRIAGRLDDEGFARLSGLPEGGTCRVSFPDLDKDAWIQLETHRGSPGA